MSCFLHAKAAKQGHTTVVEAERAQVAKMEGRWAVLGYFGNVQVADMNWGPHSCSFLGRAHPDTVQRDLVPRAFAPDFQAIFVRITLSYSTNWDNFLKT